MIEVKNLCGGFSQTMVINDISFKLQNGKSYGIFGHSGSGKSTLMAMLAGSLDPMSGSVLINGFDIQKEEGQAKKCIGYLPQGLTPYREMTPLEYLLFVADVKNLPYNRSVRQAHELLELIGIKNNKTHLIKYLSKGHERCLAILQSMLGKPEILFLDDPYDSLGVNDAQTVRTLLSYVAKHKTTVISGPYLPDLRQECHEVMILSQGKIIDVRDPFDSTLEPFLATLPRENKTKKVEKKRKKTSRTISILTQKNTEYEWIDDIDKNKENKD